MCGITGKINLKQPPSRELILRMTMSLFHRGPDNQEVRIFDNNAGLGHTRLSIIDLSDAANQPMVDHSGRYVITYNGEIYNFREIRTELEQCGYVFSTKSDTEVVLNSYAKWKTRAFEKFNGMFALAIWDRKEKELIIARDRFGKKPIYYTEIGGHFTFASELRALLEDDAIRREISISITALNHYFALGYILSPTTIYRGIFKLEPASYLRYVDGRVSEKTRYWDYASYYHQTNKQPEVEIIHKLEHLFERAVERRLVSDVKVGAFLSGGLDSSAVCAFAKHHLPYDLHTFSIGFEYSSYSELPDAEVVAKFLNTRHHSEIQGNHGGKDFINKAIEKYDEPFSDTSLVPMVAVARTAADRVKVILSGDGADELFAGYQTYLADRLKKRMQFIPQGTLKLISRIMSKSFPETTNKVNFGYKIRQFSRGIAESSRFAHYSWRELHSESERIHLIGREHEEQIRDTHPFNIFQEYYNEVEGVDPLNQHIYVDIKTFLAEDILVKVDRATMAWSLEARSPFLDAELAQYVASIPPKFKLHGGSGKHILKKMLSSHLPSHTIKKKKAGFNAPINHWLDNREENEFRFFNKYAMIYFQNRSKSVLAIPPSS
jgi:asparagine synthase (glutamine-hydrolysing)